MWEERWHPLREEWVIVAAHRQNRPWSGETVQNAQPELPDYVEDCYLCPGNLRVSGRQNENYGQTFVFDNDHPCVGWEAPAELEPPPGEIYRNRPAQIEEGLDVTKLMADRIRKLALDILYYSKDRNLEIEEVEVWRFAKDVAIQMERRIKAANIEFISEISRDCGFFEIDPEIIRAALINILTNDSSPKSPG